MRFIKTSEARSYRCCAPEGCGDIHRPDELDNVESIGRVCIGSACMAWRTDQDFSDPDRYGYYALAGSPYRIVVHPKG